MAILPLDVGSLHNSSFAENRIVMLSTHIVTDVEYIADEILMIKNGALLKKGAENDIIQEISGKVWECRVTRKEADYPLSST